MRAHGIGGPPRFVGGWGAWLVAASIVGGACQHAGTTTTPAPVARHHASSLDDSVVVGYGLQSRRMVTQAIGSTTYAHDEIQRVGATHVLQLLEGRVAGVTVRQSGGDYVVRIRGATSGAFNGEPLYVVDGIPLGRGQEAQGALSAINPNDVARIDVLKDAGAAAIYGSRAGNGVIVISMRRGDR